MDVASIPRPMKEHSEKEVHPIDARRLWGDVGVGSDLRSGEEELIVRNGARVRCDQRRAVPPKALGIVAAFVSWIPELCSFELLMRECAEPSPVSLRRRPWSQSTSSSRLELGCSSSKGQDRGSCLNNPFALRKGACPELRQARCRKEPNLWGAINGGRYHEPRSCRLRARG